MAVRVGIRYENAISNERSEVFTDAVNYGIDERGVLNLWDAEEVCIGSVAAGQWTWVKLIADKEDHDG